MFGNGGMFGCKPLESVHIGVLEWKIKEINMKNKWRKYEITYLHVPEIGPTYHRSWAWASLSCSQSPLTTLNSDLASERDAFKDMCLLSSATTFSFDEANKLWIWISSALALRWQNLAVMLSTKARINIVSRRQSSIYVMCPTDHDKWSLLFTTPPKPC